VIACSLISLCCEKYIEHDKTKDVELIYLKSLFAFGGYEMPNSDVSPRCNRTARNPFTGKSKQIEFPVCLVIEIEF